MKAYPPEYLERLQRIVSTHYPSKPAPKFSECCPDLPYHANNLCKKCSLYVWKKSNPEWVASYSSGRWSRLTSDQKAKDNAGKRVRRSNNREADRESAKKCRSAKLDKNRERERLAKAAWRAANPGLEAQLRREWRARKASVST